MAQNCGDGCPCDPFRVSGKGNPSWIAGVQVRGQEYGENPFAYVQDEGGNETHDPEVSHDVRGARGAATRAADINPFLPADNQVSEGNGAKQVCVERSKG